MENKKNKIKCESWNCLMEQKINNIDKILTKITVIQEGQAKQLSDFLIIINSFNLSVEKTKQNTIDINRLGKKLDSAATSIYIKETAMKESISINRKEIDTISHNRLWKSISIAVMVTTFAFGYLYLDIKHIMSKESMIISNQVEIKNEIIHINRSIKKFETIQNAQRNHTH